MNVFRQVRSGFASIVTFVLKRSPMALAPIGFSGDFFIYNVRGRVAGYPRALQMSKRASPKLFFSEMD